MFHYILGGALVVVPLLLAAAVLGLFGYPELHLRIALAAAILTVGLHSLFIMFMIVTGRILREAVKSRDLGQSFLDELITWRELGYNMCAHRDDYDQYESLPDWARKTLEEHESDRREFCYEQSEFESATTHDKLWNAAQNQLVSEGQMHNYLRMLWGKKILHWSESPRAALATMIELNNKYALDGRNPNSYSGIFWVLGRYDRAWGPEREIFGKIRYMSSENTARKLKVKTYIQHYGG